MDITEFNELFYKALYHEEERERRSAILRLIGVEHATINLRQWASNQREYCRKVYDPFDIVGCHFQVCDCDSECKKGLLCAG